MSTSTRQSAALKLAAFAAVLGLVFAGAGIVGSTLGPDREDDAAARTGGHAGADSSHGAESETKAAGVRGLAVANDGLKLELERTSHPRGRASELRFQVVGSDGRAVRDFEVEHERRLHLIVVRRDGQGFQHLHPRLERDGTWTTKLTLPEAGAYRVFADFTREGEAQTLAADLVVDGDAGYAPFPEPATVAGAGDGYKVRLDAGRVRAGHAAELDFKVSRDGREIETEPYLGAGGHLVALREGDLAFLHVHPNDGGVSFESEFPSAGSYLLYLQFKHRGRVHTAAFTLAVSR